MKKLQVIKEYSIILKLVAHAQEHLSVESVRDCDRGRHLGRHHGFSGVSFFFLGVWREGLWLEGYFLYLGHFVVFLLGILYLLVLLQDIEDVFCDIVVSTRMFFKD